MGIDDFRERALVCGPLPFDGALGRAGVDSEPVEKKFAELLRGIGVESRRSVPEYSLGQGEQFPVELAAVLLERAGVDPHSVALHVDENLYKRLFCKFQCLEHPRFGDHRPEHIVKLQRDVSVFGGVVENVLRLERGHAELLLAALLLADQFFDRYRTVAEILLRQCIHTVSRRRVETVVFKHRVAGNGS